MKEKVLFTKSDEGEAGMEDAEFYQLSFDENHVALIEPYRYNIYQNLEDGRKMKESKMN